ncbi:MAG: DEAD/DEAH box helicase family protein, partial [Cyanobacteria bacterium J06635_13]
MNQINWARLATLYRQKHLSRRLHESSRRYDHHSKVGIPRFPEDLKLRAYQHQAIANWLENKGRGTLKMATGSGKTIIALAIACELHQQIGLQVLLIVCPTQHLVNQWSRECRKFNLQPITAMVRVDSWQGELSNQLFDLQNSARSLTTIITTNSTLISDGFQSQLPYLPPKTLIVGDEAHNLGSTQIASRLPRNI